MGKTIFIYGEIGKEVNAKEIIQEINSEDDFLNVHINSPGGDVIDGFAIFNALQRKQHILKTFIDGLAYSAASWIALSAKPENRYMSKNSFFGIHQALSFAGGNKEELQKNIAFLSKIDQIQIEIYTAATGLNETVITDLMKSDEPLTFKEAAAFGFQEFSPQKIAALFNLDKMDFEKLTAFLKGKEEAPADVKSEIEKETKEAIAKADTVKDQLFAEFTSQRAFKEHSEIVGRFVDKVVAYINAQPTKEQIENWIEAKANEKVALFVAQVRSKGEIPAPHDIELEKVPQLKDEAKISFRNKIEELEANFKK